MISLTPAQRRAEEFAARVDDPDGATAASARDSDMLELVGAMRSVPAPTARPEFVASLRERLMIEAEVALSPDSAERRLTIVKTHSPRRRDRRVAILAGTIAAIGATSSVAMASQAALPGDTLYPIKRAIEGAQTSLTVSEAAKAETLLENANGRLSEVEELAAQLDLANSTALPSTLGDFSDQAAEAATITFDRFEEDGDSAPMAELRQFSADAMERLGGLEALLPSEAVDALNSAVETLLSIDTRIATLCPDCEGSLIELPPRLLLSLRAADAGPQVSARALAPTPSETPAEETPETPPLDAPAQVVGDDVIDVDELERLLGAAEPTTGDTPSVTTESDTKSPARERAEKAAKELQYAINEGGEALHGEEGLLGPVVSPLRPILDPLLLPLIGKGGLLNP